MRTRHLCPTVLLVLLTFSCGVHVSQTGEDGPGAGEPADCGAALGTDAGPLGAPPDTGPSGDASPLDPGPSLPAPPCPDGDSGETDSDGASDTGSHSYTFASGPDWESYDGLSGHDLGAAMPVCLAPTRPASCPAGALVYGYPPTGWNADISTISGAEWIWRADVALDAEADLLVASFKKSFLLGANGSGQIRIAADDAAEVYVNGVLVGAVGSVTDPSASGSNTLVTLNLSPALQAGKNTLEVRSQNGPAAFSGGACGPCTYRGNPAGVVFGGVLSSP